MRKKFVVIGLILSILVLGYSFFVSYSKQKEVPKDKLSLIDLATYNVVTNAHFNELTFDDKFSNATYEEYLKNLDIEKKYFTQKDIDFLQKYKNQIDDAFEEGNLKIFEYADSIYIKRLNQTNTWLGEILSNPFNFNENESVAIKADDIKFEKDDKALKERWRKLLKYRTLIKYADLKADQEKVKDSLIKNKAFLTDIDLEKKSRENTQKLYERYFKKLSKMTTLDRFTIYLNSILTEIDPHTDFFPPAQKEDFDNEMAGSFSGIGAQLRQDEDKIVVERIVVGSPCYKQGQLKKGDIITKVAQADQTPVDIAGMDLEDVVKLIRGKKGTEVRLSVTSLDGSQKAIPIIRDQVDLEDTYVKSAIATENGKKIAYISLPEFYFDTRVSNGRRCAVDMKHEIENLKKENIDGIVIDLRNNGGGSLSDVVEIAGLFIDKGPIVKVQSRDGKVENLNDEDKEIVYSGPLCILVNESSASASEILAAALQDYHRAAILGNTTYGKGTVQRFIDLSKVVSPNVFSRFLGENADENAKDLGSLKITIQKFYRINGGSTQQKGVSPDLFLPNIYEYIDRGERMISSSLPWDSIAPSKYAVVQSDANIKNALLPLKPEVAKTPFFEAVNSVAKYLKKEDDKIEVSLKYDNFLKAKKERENEFKSIDKFTSDSASNILFATSNPSFRIADINKDSTSINKNKDWLKAISKDYYIDFALKYLAKMPK